MRSRDACMMKVMPMTADHGTPLVRLAPPSAIMGDTELTYSTCMYNTYVYIYTCTNVKNMCCMYMHKCSCHTLLTLLLYARHSTMLYSVQYMYMTCVSVCKCVIYIMYTCYGTLKSSLNPQNDTCMYVLYPHTYNMYTCCCIYIMTKQSSLLPVV